MQFDPEKHHRRSIRMPHYDYASAGVYFVTCVARHRFCFFGDVVEEQMQPSAAGEMVAAQWCALETRFPFCECDEFIVMPNHFHGLLIFHEGWREFDWKTQNRDAPPCGTLPDSLGRVMQAFKSLSTNAYIRGVHEENWPRFEKKLWLRNYWERVVRDEDEWRRAREYILNNPANWPRDKHHPEENARLRALRDM